MARVLDTLVTRLGFDVDLSKLRRFESRVGRARQRLENLVSISSRAGAALTGLATGAVIGFAGFESELAKIEGLVGISREQLNDWKDDLTAISRETGQAPVELAKALFFVTSAGLRGSAAIDILRQSARASAAGLGEQTTIVDLLTSAMNAYGPEVLSATKATDALTEAVRLGKLEPASLAGAMGRVLPIASAMGVQFNEVAGLLAAMSRTGTTAEEGVTQLNAVMNGMLNPAQGAEKALKKVGLTFENLRKVVKDQGLFAVLQTLRTAFQNNNQALVEVFPNIRALRGVFDLLGPGLETNRELLKDMADSAGVLDEAFSAVEGTIKHRFNQALAGLKAGAIAIGEELKPLTIGILGFANKAVDAFLNMPGPVKAAVGAVLAMGPALLGVAAAAQAASFALGGFGTIAGTLGKAAGAFRNAWLASFAAVSIAGTTSATAINTAWSRLILTMRFGGIKGLLLSAAGWFKAAGATAATFIGAKAVGAFGLLKGAIAAIGVALAGIGWPVVLILAAAATALLVAWKPVSTFFTGLWRGLVDNSGQVGEAFGRLMNALGPVGSAITALFTGIGDGFSWLMNLLPDLTAEGEGFGEAIINGLVAVVDAITNTINWIKNIDLAEAGRAMIQSFIDGIVGQGSFLGDAVRSVLGGIDSLLPKSDAREGPLSRLTESGRAIMETLAAGIRTATPLEMALAGALTLPVGPVPQQAVGGRSMSITVNLNEGSIQIDARGGNSQEIAGAVGDRLREEIRRAVEQVDSQVLA